MKKRSATEKAKRDKKFFEKLARRNNPVRGALCLPPDVKLEDLDWNESFAEKGFRRLREMDEKFEKQELAYLRSRCKLLEKIITKDREDLRLEELSFGG